MMQNVVVVKCIVWGDVRMATANVSKKSGQRIMDRVTDDIKASVRFIQSYFSRYLDRMLTPPVLRMLVFTNEHKPYIDRGANGPRGVLPHIRVGVLPQS